MSARNRCQTLFKAGKVSDTLSGVAASLLLAAAASAAEIVVYGFEGSPEGWEIPDWAKSSEDYVGEELAVSDAHQGEGAYALEVRLDFPGDRWAGAYVERELEVTDWTTFGQLSADLYLPAEAPEGLQAKIILTVGDQWQWTEMNRAVPLSPGQWTTLSVNLKPGSLDWKFFPDEAFRKSVRKLGIRVESNNGPTYHGSVFIDNVRLAE